MIDLVENSILLIVAVDLQINKIESGLYINYEHDEHSLFIIQQFNNKALTIFTLQN